jgi:WD40 repeat protein
MRRRALVVSSCVLGATIGVVSGCPAPDLNGDELPCARCDVPNRRGNGVSDAEGGAEASTGEPPPDAGPPPPKCASATPFGAAKLVAGIDPNRHASSPHLTPDENTLYFTSADPDVAAQIYRATRAKRDDPFGAVAPMPNINSPSNDNDPTASADALTLLFHSGRSGNNDVWWSRRASVNVEFPAPEAVGGIATAQYEGQGFLHVATGELWFVSDRNGSFDIFRAKPNGNAFSDPTPVTELNTPQGEFLPWLTADGLTISFSSTREGTLGGQDLFVATRATANGAFGAPVPLKELNTAGTEQAGSISPDNCRIYFSREGGPGGQQLWVAERPLAP